MELVNVLKQMSLETQKSSCLTDIFMGTVLSDAPLEIETEQKIHLKEQQLILSRNVTDFEVEMTVSHSTEKALGLHNHTINNRFSDCGATIDDTDLTHYHEYKGKKGFTVHNALKEGEKVILISETGGQRFYVIDRIGGV